MPASAGHHARLSYLWENDSSDNPDFLTSSPSDTDNKPFGSDATINTREGSNNAVRVFDPASREAREVIEQNFEGSWSVEFTATNPWFLRGVIHNSVSTSGTDPYTHTFDGDVPYPLRIIEGNEATGNEYELKGCVIASCQISANVDGMVNVTLDGAYADEEQVVSNDTASLTPQPTTQERPFTFADATLSRKGSTLSLIQNAQLNIENNTDLIGELGVRTAVAYSPKVRSVSLSYGDVVEDDKEIKRMYGSSTSSSPESHVDNEVSATFQFDNGKSGTDKRSITLNLSGTILNTYSRSGGGDPEADLEGTMNEIPVSVDATAENATDTAR